MEKQSFKLQMNNFMYIIFYYKKIICSKVLAAHWMTLKLTGRNFSICNMYQTGCRAHPPSSPMGIRGSLPWE
jgi:hypothetical protein